jgi:hypothetical protein
MPTPRAPASEERLALSKDALKTKGTPAAAAAAFSASATSQRVIGALDLAGPGDQAKARRSRTSRGRDASRSSKAA